MERLTAAISLTLAVLLGSAGVSWSAYLILECSPDIFPEKYLEVIQTKNAAKIKTDGGVEISSDSSDTEYVQFLNRTGFDVRKFVTFFNYKKPDELTGELPTVDSTGVVFNYNGNSVGVCFDDYHVYPQAILIEYRYFYNPFRWASSQYSEQGWEKHITFSTMSVTSCGSPCSWTSVETVSFPLHDPTENHFWGREIYGGMGDSQWFWDRLALEEARSISGGNSFAWRGELYDCDNSDACKIVGPNP